MFPKLPPFLAFNETPVEPGTTPPPTEKPGDAFPKDTPVAEMTPEQQVAYWRHQSKTQQKDADAFRKLGLTPEAIKKVLDDAEAARVAALGDQEKALDTARKEGQTAAVLTAQEKYLRPAIEGQVIGLTRTIGETPEDALTRVQGALQFVDVTKFLNDTGDLDAAKIQTFAQSIGPKDGNGESQSDPLYDILSRQQAQQPSSGSVDQYEKAAYERLSKK